MEATEGKGGGGGVEGGDCVRVAVNIRPLIAHELNDGCTDCTAIVPGEPQVQIGSHAFTFDYVYGSTGSPSSALFRDCVAPLCDALFCGYNATVLAYGQTGSGKTYTMGTNYSGDSKSGGVIPEVMESIFSRIEELKENTEFLIRVSFIEIFKEEVFDLLDPTPLALLKGEGSNFPKLAIPSRTPIQIRETINGGITLAGVTEPEVRSKEEMAAFLCRGSLARATGSTNMNSQSSRSHAIFTISMEQKRANHGSSSVVVNDDFGGDILSAKLHLVDLAGSERAKRTGADGMRLKEGIHINRGLLALGNVISALGDEKKRKEGGHVPYRDSKLTRLLQDSLGGNSKTVMIACVSPADSNAEETLNTLKYANRARNIQNKAIINRDPMAAQMQRMRSQVEQLQAELLCFRGEGGTPFEELQILRHKISVLEASNLDLHRDLQERQKTCEFLSQRAFDAQVEKDNLIMIIESARSGKSWSDIDSSDSKKDNDLVKSYVSKIQSLEGELLRLQSLNNHTHRNDFLDCLDLEDDAKAVDASGDIEEVEEKELEYSSLQEKMDKELQELDKRLEEKEAEMKRYGKVDTSVLKQHYEKKVHELEEEKRVLTREIEILRSNLANISSTSDDGAQKLKEAYLQKLNALEKQVSELKKKQDAQSQLLRQKQKSDEAAKHLQEEIHRIKTHKVQLQQKIKQESEQFRMWKASREKEVLQLKKEGRRNEYEMHKLVALNQRQKMVLQRKTEEASLATKRLKELLEAKKTASRIGNSNGPGIQALMQAVEHELEVTVRVHEVRSEYEQQMEARGAMAKELSRLKDEHEAYKQKKFGGCRETVSPGARNSRIFALENMLATSSTTLVAMASQLSEAEERERIFSGRGRWNQVRSLPEAKNMMNHLFNLASSSRCLLRDKEVDCREKDSFIRDLKEKVVRLTSMVRQLEAQKDEIVHQIKLKRLARKKHLMENNAKSGRHMPNSSEEQAYDLRKVPRNYGTDIDLFEDMDTSDSEMSDVEYEPSYSDLEESVKLNDKKRVSRTGGRGVLEALSFQNLADNTGGKATSRICCSCTKNSACKTTKCECRAIGGACGDSCGCNKNKCANREPCEILVIQDDSNDSVTSTEDCDRHKDLVSEGLTLLLESVSSVNPSELKNEGGETRRKPLADIGNKSQVSKPSQRKRWKKSVIQLVPSAPVPQLPPSNQSEEVSDIPPKLENNLPEQDVALKLPRAMWSTNVNHNPLRERNSENGGEATNRDVLKGRPRSPIRLPKDSDHQKENHGI